MATRRNVRTEGNETADIGKDNVVRGPVGPASKAPKSLNVPSAVVAKLLLFTLAMVAAPLATYYISVTRVFVGNATAAGALAAVAANVVLIAYVVVAMAEDDTDERDKKSQ